MMQQPAAVLLPTSDGCPLTKNLTKRHTVGVKQCQIVILWLSVS